MKKNLLLVFVFVFHSCLAVIGTGAPCYLPHLMRIAYKKIFLQNIIEHKIKYIEKGNYWLINILIDKSLSFKVKVDEYPSNLKLFSDIENIYITANDKLILIVPQNKLITKKQNSKSAFAKFLKMARY